MSKGEMMLFLEPKGDNEVTAKGESDVSMKQRKGVKSEVEQRSSEERHRGTLSIMQRVDMMSKW